MRARGRAIPRLSPRSEEAASRLGVGLAAALCLAFVTVADSPAAGTAISTSFEAGESGAYALGSLNGQHGWQVAAGAAAVLESPDYASTGTRGVQLLAASQPLSAAHVAWDGATSGLSGVVYFDFRVRIRGLAGRRLTITGYDLFGAERARTFVIDFDLPAGQTGAVRAWERYGKNAAGSYTIGVWHRLTGRVDYDAGFYQLRLVLGPAATLDFRDAYTPSASGSRPAPWMRRSTTCTWGPCRPAESRFLPPHSPAGCTWFRLRWEASRSRRPGAVTRPGRS